MLQEKKAANLKTVAAKVGLAPCSVSAILNNSEASRAIPQTTKDRVYRAATELNYHPNLWARSLRTKRTRIVAVMAPDLGRGAVARVVAAAQQRLQRSGYMLVLIASDPDDGNHLCAQFQQRGIEGVIAIDANVPRHLNLPVTCLSLNYGASQNSIADELQASFLEMGDSAAQTLMRQIEYQTEARRMKVEAKMPPAFLEVRSVDLSFTPTAESA